jgi:adenosylmethionine-8-amino-7-oxononanoate aminotransferase
MSSKILFPFAVNAVQPLRVVNEYTKYGFIENGKEFIDLTLGSCGCFPLGFKRTEIIEYVNNRMVSCPFSSGEYFTTNSAVLELGDRLYKMSKGYRSVFSLSGSDAIEGAIKMAQLYNGKNKFLGFKKSYHGSTYMSSSISDATYITNVFGKDSRCIISEYTLDKITDDLCAVIIETSSWQNGLYNPGKEFWEGLRKICTDKNIVLIVDDIAMCGGKTNTFFGWTGLVEPDIFTMGKSLTAGYFPLSATLANSKIYNKTKDKLWPHGFSYSFNLSGVYSTLAYLDIIEKENLFSNTDKLIGMGKFMCDTLVKKKLTSDYTNHGLVFNLNLLQNTLSEKVFENHFYQYGISARLRSLDGGLLFIIPIDADEKYFVNLEDKLTQALTTLF